MRRGEKTPKKLCTVGNAQLTVTGNLREGHVQSNGEFLSSALVHDDRSLDVNSPIIQKLDGREGKDYRRR